ncbi:hypothetical protein AB0H77_42250 [Streptomyces sp. NPDC050844]|uniref:hypothetical protein n=1 Tax=Streptomyces sp. NPDC050844 TaxID=3155790 RepID=UPI0033D508D7
MAFVPTRIVAAVVCPGATTGAYDQIHHNTYRPAPLKHRRPREFRDVPLPRSVREAIERFAQRHGTTHEGYLLRKPNGYFTYRIESTRAAKLHAALPPPDGMTLSSYRDLFASVCLHHGIPSTAMPQTTTPPHP